MTRVQGRLPTISTKCGTYAGEMRHRRLEEMSCDDCNLAQANYQAMTRRGRAVEGVHGLLHRRPDLADMKTLGATYGVLSGWSA